MWLDNLKELKKAKGMSTKQIAEATKLPERTISRIFSGDTDNPYVDTLHRIVTVLGSSLDNILADTKTVVGDSNLIALQEELNIRNNELKLLQDDCAILQERADNLTAENEKLKMQLAHKEELLAVHNYYIKKLNN